MKKCKANYIKILAAMRTNSYDVAKLFEKDGDMEAAQKEYGKAYAYQTAIWLLSDYDGSYRGYGKIYFPKEFDK